MKVILLENVRKVGSIGEIIDIKRGYARNFLIAQKKALFVHHILHHLFQNTHRHPHRVTRPVV